MPKRPQAGFRRGERGGGAWLAFWYVTISALSAKCWISPCVKTATGGNGERWEAAKKKLSSANFEVLITDIKMPQTDGIEVLRFARQSSPETSVILLPGRRL